MNTNAVIIADTTADSVPVLDQVQGLAIEWGLKIVAFLLVLIVGMWIAKLVKKGVVSAMDKKGLDKTLSSFVGALVHVGMQAFVIVAALR